MDKATAAYDLIVVGGGIVGTGITRDAAARGLRVALFEKDDYGAGTTSRSTRLIHGGLRYLELLELGLVHESLRERRLLLDQAPHLVKPLPFLFPVYKGRGHPYLVLWSGMVLYDVLSVGKALPHHLMIAASDCLELEPSLRPEGLRGGFVYYDAQCSFPERLSLENVLDAVRLGATAENHTEVTGLLTEAGRITGVRTRNLLDGSQGEARAPIVINAAGPWVDAFLDAVQVSGPERLVRSKGIHLVTPRFTKHALIMETEDTRRIFFAIPWHGYTLIGTTDTKYEGDNDGVAADDEDIDYLIRETRRILNVDLERKDVLFTTAGLRALPKTESLDVGAITRRHVVIDHGGEGGPRGLYSVLGGKITTYREIAEDVVDRVHQGRRIPRSTTADRRLPGASTDWTAERARRVRAAIAAGLAEDTAEYLADLYGIRADGVIKLVRADASTAVRLAPERPDILAQVDFAVEEEHARTVIDVLLRRTTLGLSQGVALQALDVVAQRMASRLGWDEERTAREKEAYRDRVGRMGPFAPPAAVEDATS